MLVDNSLKRWFLPLALIVLCGSQAHGQAARDYISVVGSSTVYPFATVVAERFGNTTRFNTPKIESTGSGGGLKLFCGGVGVNHPDITNSSRRIKQSEIDNCAANGVDEIIEIKIGYDGIVLANAIDAVDYSLTLREIFLALGKDVPDPRGGQTLVANPYEKWSDINPSLPDRTIEVLGPPPTSGTRDAFAELGLEGGCKTFDWIKALKDSDEDRFKGICHGVREDGRHYVEAGENDNLIVQKLRKSPEALGVFGFSFLDQNSDVVKAARVNGKEPTFDAIASGEYAISRSLYFYVKKAHIGAIPGIKEYLEEFTSERAMGDFGYLADKGLIPLSEEEYEEVLSTVRNLTPLRLASD